VAALVVLTLIDTEGDILDLLRGTPSSVVKIDLPNTKTEEQENSEFHAINVATDYAGLKKAFTDADAIIHLAAIPSPGGPDEDPAVSRHSCPSFEVGPGTDANHRSYTPQTQMPASMPCMQLVHLGSRKCVRPAR